MSLLQAGKDSVHSWNIIGIRLYMPVSLLVYALINDCPLTQ